MTTPEIVAAQSSTAAPQSTEVASGTNLLLPPRRAASQFDHFPEEVYDLSAESNLVRFLKVLLGDAGVGQLRKRMLMARMQQTAQGTHFYDLDRFYGGLFGVRRSAAEALDLDPSTQTATAETWSIQRAKDASYRSRVTQFSRALSYGGTPTGMELIAEALLAVDCEIYEQWPDGTLANQRSFIVRPKREITQAEAYDLTKILRRFKPTETRFTIETAGAAVHSQVPLRAALADSAYWEIIPRVVPRTDLVVDPYQVSSASAVEQPRPPFSGYQGEAWSYSADVVGVSAFAGAASLPTQRVVLADETFLDYAVHDAMLPKRHILAGRSVSDGILVTHPLWSQSRSEPSLAPLYTDRVPVESLGALLRAQGESLPQNPAERFWATPERPKTDPTTEGFEVRLYEDRLINHISFDVAHFPQDVLVETFDGARWHPVATRSVSDSVPQYLMANRPTTGHPQHSHPTHWEHLSVRIEPVLTRGVRVSLTRVPGAAPINEFGAEVDYSLAVRNFDLGYRISALTDVPEDLRDGSVIGRTTDPLGSTVEFVLRQEGSDDLLTGGAWRCEPQPVNYAVVNLYVDVRTAAPDNDAQVIERFFLDPTHTGASLTIYWTAEVGEPSDAFYEQATWTPIPRDYVVQKGYLHLPPTRARHFKFEFTSLSAEPIEAFLPMSRTVRMFPRSLVSQIATGSVPDEALPPGLSSALEMASVDRRYADAVDLLSRDPGPEVGYSPTEALYSLNPTAAAEAASRSWIYGFQPWHQGGVAPRFPFTQRHQYETLELSHNTKVGFFVGLKALRAYRLDGSADDDTKVYLDHFHDFRQISPGFTWTFNPNVLTTEIGQTAVATSKVYGSRHNVRALQFATQQTDPEQLVPDDDFRDPLLASTDWLSDDTWHKVGNGLPVYSPADHSVVVVRYAVPLLRPEKPETRGLVQPIIHPTQAYRPGPTVDGEASANQIGGLESPLLGPSAQGRAYAATRVTLATTITDEAPLRLQVVVGDTRDVLSEILITGQAGETIEKVLPHALTGGASVRVRLVQMGVATSEWKIDALSFFDDGILWEFSVDGGTTWVPAIGVRNNANGIVTFPTPGKQLRWRATGLRARMAINALKMRPQYDGVANARDLGAQRGPNVSVYDAEPPVQQDPMFTDWGKPVPRHWYAAYKRFPKLPVSGAPNVTEFARFYGRPYADTIAAPTEVAVPWKLAKRSTAQALTTADAITRTGTLFKRSAVDTDGSTADSAALLIVQPPGGGVVNRVIHPTF